MIIAINWPQFDSRFGTARGQRWSGLGVSDVKNLLPMATQRGQRLVDYPICSALIFWNWPNVYVVISCRWSRNELVISGKATRIRPFEWRRISLRCQLGFSRFFESLLLSRHVVDDKRAVHFSAQKTGAIKIKTGTERPRRIGIWMEGSIL